LFLIDRLAFLADFRLFPGLIRINNINIYDKNNIKTALYILYKQMEAQLPKEKITHTEYMRNYKRKQYAENPEEIKAKNKAYYAKYKYGMSSEEMKTYGTLLPIVSKIKKNCDALKVENVEFLRNILNSYLEQIEALIS